ncbi:DUF1761 domain-containing protein [Microbacterium sp. Leaf320]|uniref:DUF1761 domain-containing protein n=1 Tax=Microbacterium sp. Leaf320 TaxID=1736334 RepID=UPI0006FEEBC7|nr:DUF1761 domain-containing protein [Microbacterium sp. Leaf320]KQQ65353.1 hypothetical protein ASF63_15550 [Microbacterium sp. Leaf320]
MEFPEINVLAVVAATASSMLVGFVFYHPRVFGTGWMRAIGHAEESTLSTAGWVYAVPLLGSAVTALVLAVATAVAFDVYGGSFLVTALGVSLVLYVGMTAARVLVHDAFDPRRFRVTGYTLLNEFFTIAVMGFIIGVWPPA